MSGDGKYAGPRLTDRGFPAGPMLYAATLRRISDALTALEGFGQHDPSTGHHILLASGDIAVYLEDDIDDGEPPVGWLTLIDENAWVFVPYIAAVESSGAA